jgi:hypothetical protein
MRIIRYKQSEFLMPWKWRKKKSLHRFILDIPYALYYSVVPGREALNEVLCAGTAGGGMGTGLYWDAFEISEEDYAEVTEAWKSFDLRSVLTFKPEDIPDLHFIFDEEIMAIPGHLDYLRSSREKYERRFKKQV